MFLQFRGHTCLPPEDAVPKKASRPPFTGSTPPLPESLGKTPLKPFFGIARRRPQFLARMPRRTILRHSATEE